MNIQHPEWRWYFYWVEHWSWPPVQGLCYVSMLHFQENTGGQEEDPEARMVRSLGTIPKITKGIRIFKSGERRIWRDITDISVCFMDYLLEELDLFFVVSGGRGRITGKKLHRSRFMLNIRRNFLTLREVQKWNRLAHHHWEVFTLRLSDLKIIWLHGRYISAVTQFYDEPSKSAEKNFLTS